MHPRRRCDHCGQLFLPKYANLKLCFDCFRKREKALAEYDALQSELSILRDENANLCRQLNRIITQPQATGIPRDLLPKLIRLCHPDKHGNTAAANDVTRWLLEQRREAA